MEGLGDSAGEARILAIYLTLQMRMEEAVPVLKRLAADDPDEAVRAAASDVLKRMNEKR